jgi:hypothetical protein
MPKKITDALVPGATAAADYLQGLRVRTPNLRATVVTTEATYEDAEVIQVLGDAILIKSPGTGDATLVPFNALRKGIRLLEGD